MNADYCQIVREASRPLQPIATGQPTVLQKLVDVRAVLFDVYGTLFISASGDVGARAATTDESAMGSVLAELLTQQGDSQQQLVDMGTREELSESVADSLGQTMLRRLAVAIEDEHVIRRAAGVEYPEVDIVQIWRSVVAAMPAGTGAVGIDLKRLAIEYEVRANPVWPMPGVADCLDRLANSGRLLGIISNAQFYTPLLFPALLDRTLDDLAFDPHVQYYSYRYGEAKPGGELYQRAVDGLAVKGIVPREVLYVGNDMLNDIAPAARSGFRTALFAGDRRSLRLRTDDSRVAGVAPDIVVSDLSAIASCVLDD